MKFWKRQKTNKFPNNIMRKWSYMNHWLDFQKNFRHITNRILEINKSESEFKVRLASEKFKFNPYIWSFRQRIDFTKDKVTENIISLVEQYRFPVTENVTQICELTCDNRDIFG